MNVFFEQGLNWRIAQTTEFQYVVNAEARAQDELLGGCLLQGCHARRTQQTREDTQTAPRSQAGRLVSVIAFAGSFSSDLDFSNDFQFFPPKLAELQERELAAFKVCISTEV
jgi:hypothetical protein